jgi:hypothetical protein
MRTVVGIDNAAATAASTPWRTRRSLNRPCIPLEFE